MKVDIVSSRSDERHLRITGILYNAGNTPAYDTTVFSSDPVSDSNGQVFVHNMVYTLTSDATIGPKENTNFIWNSNALANPEKEMARDICGRVSYTTTFDTEAQINWCSHYANGMFEIKVTASKP